MPLYDYDCADCGERFEVLRGVHADPPTACPLCGGGPIKKAFTTPAIHFKGTGWAKKERRSTSGSSTSRAAGDAGSAASDEGKSPKEAAATGKDGGSGASSGDGASASSSTAEKSASGGSTKASSSGSSAGRPSGPATKEG